jgi:uncharacterized caspase-like protein
MKFSYFSPSLFAFYRGFMMVMRIILILCIGLSSCSTKNVHYKPDEIIVKLDKDVQREIKARPNESLKEMDKKYSVTNTSAKSGDQELYYGDYYALVIGVNNYSYLSSLKTAINDSRTVAYTLKNDYGFKVKLLLDPNREEIISALHEYRKQLTLKDNLVIYYAGHGWLDREADEGYWLPADAKKENEANWISNATITSNLRAMEAKHIMVISDSCYSGKLTRSIKIVEQSPNYLNRLSEKRTRVVLSSGGVEPVIDSSLSDKHSIFAYAFIKALKENNKIITGTDLYTKIRSTVILNSDQTPEYADIHKAGHDGGDFIFQRKAKKLE